MPTLAELHEQEGAYACEGVGGDGFGCIDGRIYGPCGHENCYGVCTDVYGSCPCRCHKEDIEVVT